MVKSLKVGSSYLRGRTIVSLSSGHNWVKLKTRPKPSLVVVKSWLPVFAQPPVLRVGRKICNTCRSGI